MNDKSLSTQLIKKNLTALVICHAIMKLTESVRNRDVDDEDEVDDDYHLTLTNLLSASHNEAKVMMKDFRNFTAILTPFGG